MHRITVLGCQLAVMAATCLRCPSYADDHPNYASELPRIAPMEPADAISGFSIADGFSVQLVAAEPLVSSPVAIEWDSHGQLYVCEMRGYSENRDDGISRITRLEDTDDDGVFDKSVVFADKLLWPTAIFPFDDGLFVGDAPDIYYFKDTNGDGKADVRRVVLTGFGTSNVQGLFNSFRWGLDNRIHIACSSVGGDVRQADAGEEAAVSVRGRDLAFNPRTFELELTSGGAQHGMCFDDWGRKFLSSNSDHLQQAMYEDRYVARNPLMTAPRARVSIAADGPQAEVYRSSPVEPWRIVRTRLRASGQVPGIVEGGGRAAGYFTGATGATIYRGDAWPIQHRGTAIVGDVGSNLVHRKRLEQSGLPFVAHRIDEQSELLSSRDIWFRPAQFAGGPDGALHVIDVYREVIEHPKSLPPEIKQHLDLTAGRDRGRIYRIVPDDFQHRATPKLSSETSGNLIALLAHPNAWHRETAARLLMERQDSSSVEPLRQMVNESAIPLARLHGLYALHALGELDELTLLGRLQDPHPQMRCHALRLSESLAASQRVRRRWLQMANDDSLEVRYQLAFTVGMYSFQDRVPILAKLIRRDIHDDWMTVAVQSSLSEGASELFATLVVDSKFRSTAAGRFLQKIADQIVRENRREAVAIALKAASGLSESESIFALPILGELMRGSSQAKANHAKPTVTAEVLGLTDKLERMVERSIRIAEDEALDLQSRVSAVSTLKYSASDQVLDALQAFVAGDHPEPLQRRAIETLGAHRATMVATTLIDAWPRYSPGLREVASEVLFATADRTLALFDAIDSGEINVRDLRRTRLDVAEKSGTPAVRLRAKAYKQSLAGQSREEIVGNYRSALGGQGNSSRGQNVFRKHCSNCHRVDGFGFEIGPSLAAIKTRGPESILVNVLDPNREVNPQYLGYVLLTHDGRAMTGMISAEGATSVTLRRAESATDEVLRSEIARLQSTGQSIMPEGLEEVIDQSAMADLIQYLMTVP